MGSSTWLVLIALGVLVLRCKPVGLFKRVTCFIPLLALIVSLMVAVPIISNFRSILTIYLSIPFLLVLGNLFDVETIEYNN